MYEVGKLYVDIVWPNRVFMITNKKRIKLVSMWDIEYSYYFLCDPNRLFHTVESVIQNCWSQVK